MPSTVQSGFVDIVTAVKAAVNSAWPEMVKGYVGQIESEVTSYPAWAIDLVSVNDSFGDGAGVSGIEQEFVCSITGAWPRPKSTDAVPGVLLFKMGKADAITSLICAGPEFASYFYLPLITKRTFKEEEIADYVTLSIEFTVKRVVSHH
jgi:hypothetical protein